MRKNLLVESATNELNETIMEGFFGDTAINLLLKKDTLPQNNFLYDSVVSIFKGNDGKKMIAGISLRLIDLYCEAIPHNPQEVIDILTAFINGTEVTPELENMSSYLEYMTAHREWNNYFQDHKGNTLNNVQKRQQAMRILNAYSKGVELAGKIFTHLIAIEKIQRDEPYNLGVLANKTIYQKLEEFKKISDERFHLLTDIIDRKIRNADSHLSATYSPINEEYTMKRINSKGKVELFKVSILDMLTSIYPKVGLFIQGYFVSCIIMVFNWSDRDLAQHTIKKIVDINNGNDVAW